MSIDKAQVVITPSLVDYTSSFKTYDPGAEFLIEWKDKDTLLSTVRMRSFRIHSQSHFNDIMVNENFEESEGDLLWNKCDTVKHLVHLAWMGVEEKYQGKGMGSFCYAYAMAAFKKIYPEALFVWLALPEEDNKLDDLVRFYNKQGGELLNKYRKWACFYSHTNSHVIGQGKIDNKQLTDLLSQYKK